MKQNMVNFFALFTSTSTLLCCALPAVIATFAGGAAVGTLLITFPWLIPISHHKEWIFLVSGLLIGMSSILTFRPQSQLACSVTGGKGCEVAGRFTKFLFWGAVAIYGTGIFFSYGIVPLLRFFD